MTLAKRITDMLAQWEKDCGAGDDLLEDDARRVLKQRIADLVNVLPKQLRASLKRHLSVEPARNADLAKAIDDELHDYAMVMDHCTKIYDHFSRGRISKPNTLPSAVIVVAEDLLTEDIQEATKELEDRLTELDSALEFSKAITTSDFVRFVRAARAQVDRGHDLACPSILPPSAAGPCACGHEDLVRLLDGPFKGIGEDAAA